MRTRFLFAAAILPAIAVSALRAETIWAIDQFNTLFSFDSGDPSVILTARNMNNVVSAAAIDFRPADGLLYIMGADGRLFSLDVYAPIPPNQNQFGIEPRGTVTGINGTSFGFDFDPVADRLRVTSDTNINLSHAVGGATVVQTPLTASYAPPCIVGSAYSNSVAGATVTTLYNIDAGRDVLTTQDQASGGQTMVGTYLGTNVDSEELGFDISGLTGIGYVVANLGGSNDSQLFTLNLSSGTLSQAGFIGNGILVRDLAVAPIPEPACACVYACGLLACRRFRPS